MLLLALAAVLGNKPFSTSGLTGSQVATSCQATTDNTSVNLCTSYTLGVFDAMSEAHLICGQHVTSIEQIVAVSKKALADHPEDWNKPPEWVMGRAFKLAFPCSP